ncbi:inactive peptidyl-prolyl cis-trans isomerase shutdown-like isoform X2 [Anticarsia gemmatalis]
MVAVDGLGLVKKKIIEEGGGLPLHEGCTVSIAYSGYFEHEQEPFDVMPVNKPLVVDLKDNGLLPGLETAVRSMLVGEMSVFLLSYNVMYGELGIPPRIKPKADCIFYVKIVKSILTPTEGKIKLSESNMFQRVHREVKKLFASGTTLYKTNNYTAAAQLFRKAVNMLHKCRLADEGEEMIQEKMLKKLYMNLVVCYNKMNKPFMTCSACNELNRLNNLWNNGKALFQNARALRMIGAYQDAEKRLLRAIKLLGDDDALKAEYEMLMKAKSALAEVQLAADEVKHLAAVDTVSEQFKKEVDELIKNFKASEDEDEIKLPSNLNYHEMVYVREACVRENLFFNQDDDDPVENASGGHES